MNRTHSSVFSRDECQTIEWIVQQLNDPLLATDRRTALIAAIDEIAARYECDLRLTDSVS